MRPVETGHGVEIRLLAYFVAVAEELSFSRAAQRLYMSQPPLTRAIKVLEARLGIELVERRAGRVALTSAGEELLRRSHEILGLHGDLVTVMGEWGDGRRRLLRLGFSGPAAGLLPSALLRRLTAAVPGLDVRLVDLGLLGDAEAVSERVVDAAIVRAPPEVPDGLASLRLVRTHVVLASSLGERPPDVGLDDFPRVALLSAPRWPSGHVCEHREVLWSSSHDEALDLVAGGLGVFYTLDTCAQRLRRDDVSFRRLPRSPDLPLQLLWRDADQSTGVLACARASAEIAQRIGEAAPGRV